jgi:hypothetical protein
MMLFLAGCAVSTAGDAEEGMRSLRVYPVSYSDPDAVRRLVESRVGEGGSVMWDARRQRFLVIATEQEHRLIGEWINQVEVPPRNVRIEVAFDRRGQTYERGAGLTGSGTVILSEGKNRGAFRLHPRLKDQRTRLNQHVTQMLLVGSGREGRLQVGQQVPFLEWIMTYGRRWGYVETRLAWQHVGSYLVVEPTVIGNGSLVRLRITPELSGTVDGDLQRIRFARAATEVVARNGEPISLAGISKDEEFYKRFLIGMDRAGHSETLNITLTPRVVDTAGRSSRDGENVPGR